MYKDRWVFLLLLLLLLPSGISLATQSSPTNFYGLHSYAVGPNCSINNSRPSIGDYVQISCSAFPVSSSVKADVFNNSTNSYAAELFPGVTSTGGKINFSMKVTPQMSGMDTVFLHSPEIACVSLASVVFITATATTTTISTTSNTTTSCILPETIQNSIVNGVSPEQPDWQFTEGGVLTKIQGSLGGTSVTVDSGTVVYPIVSSGYGNSTEQWSAVPLTYGLVGYWPLDERSGTSAFDLTGNNQTGALVNSPKWESGGSCKFGGCLNFDGTYGQYVNLGTVMQTYENGTNPISFGLWYYLPSIDSNFSGYLTILGDAEANNKNGFHLFVTTGSNSPAGRIGLGRDGRNNLVDVFSPVLPLGWHYIVGTYNGSNLSLYVDGTLAASNSTSYPISPNSILCLGANGDGNQCDIGPEAGYGTVDNVEIWSRALSSREVSDNYASSFPVLEHVASSPDSRWNTDYYHQYSVTFNFNPPEALNSLPSVNDDAFLPPRISYASLGSPKIVQANNTVWADAGCNYTYHMLPNESASNERWIGTASSENGTITSPGGIEVKYHHQFYVAFNVSSALGGSVGFQNGWYNAGSILYLAETENPGWRFEGWIGSGSGSYSGSQSTASITIAAPITELATFYPGITISSSGAGIVHYSYDSSSGIVQGGRSVTLFLPSGTNVSLSASPYQILSSFDQWSVNALGDSPQTSVVAAGPLTVGASFDYNFLNIDLIAVVLIALISVVLLVARRNKKSRSQSSQQVVAAAPETLKPIQYVDETESTPARVNAGEVLEIVLGSKFKRKVASLYIPKNFRRFFPGYKVNFVVQTDIGEIITTVTSAKAGTAIGDPDGGRYIQAGLRAWFEKHQDVGAGSKICFECIEPNKRYRLFVA